MVIYYSERMLVFYFHLIKKSVTSFNMCREQGKSMSAYLDYTQY